MDNTGRRVHSPQSRSPTDGELTDMPKFMDFHDHLPLPQQAIDELRQQAEDGTTDEFGVRQIELFHNPDGKVYCLLEGPDEEAVRQHHAALQVPCSDVHRVETLL